MNQGIRDPILQQGIRWNPRSYSGLHCRWCSVETHHEGVTIKPSSYFAHTCPDISSRGPYQQPSDYHTKLEGLTKHPQRTYPTRGPYHPPSFLTVNRGPYHNPHLTNQQEGLTNHPYIHNKISQISFSIQFKFLYDSTGPCKWHFKRSRIFFKPRIQIQKYEYHETKWYKPLTCVKKSKDNSYFIGSIHVIFLAHYELYR